MIHKSVSYVSLRPRKAPSPKVILHHAKCNVTYSKALTHRREQPGTFPKKSNDEPHGGTCFRISLEHASNSTTNVTQSMLQSNPKLSFFDYISMLFLALSTKMVRVYLFPSKFTFLIYISNNLTMQLDEPPCDATG